MNLYGQDWKKVAEGIPDKTPEKCSRIWMKEVDPAKSTKSIWSLVAKELNNGGSDFSCRMKYEYMQRKHQLAF